MSFVSIEFLAFFTAALLIYYMLPKSIQWIWLLLCSYFFYASEDVHLTVFLIFTTLTTYLTGLLLERQDILLSGQLKSDSPAPSLTKDIKKKLKAHTKYRKRWLLVLTMLLNFGVLGWLKYYNFAVENLNYFFRTNFQPASLLLPLGISFYTFQSIGYLIDVYRGKYKPERNPFRFALFISFFPQLMQGPIARFDKLFHQFFKPHPFRLVQIEQGIQLIMWGYFKKLILANRSALLVNQVFHHYEDYSGLIVVIAALFYSIQLYADFSGGMDVVTGVSECFGISLERNFKRPYFAVSISDFWHRWHITLGTWMKDYVFYPLSLSKFMNRWGKRLKQLFGKHIGRVIPVCISNLIIFFLVGIWHGADWKYIFYGLYNGMLIAFSNLLEPVYPKLFAITHINPKTKLWKVIQIVRTFVIVNISWYFDMGTSASAAVYMIKSIFSDFTLSTLWDGSLLAFSLSKMDFVALAIGCFALFLVSFFQECGISIRKSIGEKPIVFRWTAYFFLIFSIPVMGQITTIDGGGFIYAQF